MFSNKRLSIFVTLIISLIMPIVFASSIPAQAAGMSRPDDTVNGKLLSAKGKVKGFADPRQSKTISVDVKKKGIMVFRYSDATKFINFKYLTELKGETAVVKYRTVGSDKVAAVIKKAFVKLPEGVAEIKAAGMAELVKKGPEAGNYFLVDARPAKRYEEGHIPGAVSIPVSKLKKEGAELLPPDKNTPMVFYCGGPT
ncbi:MAG: rhodanese-like domain-containing protein [Nitrospirota bacterium]